MKVIDLGMARLVENDIVMTDDVLGTTGYHAPEVLLTRATTSDPIYSYSE